LKLHVSPSEDENSLERIHTFNLKSEGNFSVNGESDSESIKTLIHDNFIGNN